MSIPLKLYHMNKPRNSNRRTPATAWCSISGEFKQPYDVIHPHIIIENPAATITSDGLTFADGPGANYLTIYEDYLAQFCRYYWIVDYTWVSDKLIDLALEEDVPATFQTELMNSTQYVVRASKVYDTDLADTWYPLKAKSVASSITITSSIPWHMTTNWLGTGYFVVGIINNDSSAYGSVSYYMFNAMSYNDLRNKLLSNTTWTDMQFTQIEESLYKSLFNPMQYITGVWFYPKDPIKTRYDIVSNIPLTTLKIGWWPVSLSPGCECKRLDSPTVDTGSFNLAEYHHPDASTRGYFLDSPPYMTRTLIIPPFGAIPLDTSLIASAGAYPVATWYLDYITGKGTLIITASNSGAVLGQAEAQIAIPMTVAQSTQSIIGAFGSATGAAAGIGTGIGGFAQKDPVMGVKGMIAGAKGIESMFQQIAPRIEAFGSNGSASVYTLPAYDRRVMKYQASESRTRFGRPLCMLKQLNTLGTVGSYEFVMTDNADMRDATTMLGEERKILEDMLDNGMLLYGTGA